MSNGAHISTTDGAPDPHALLSDQELRGEIERRAREVIAGTAKTVSWDELRAGIESELDEQ